MVRLESVEVEYVNYEMIQVPIQDLRDKFNAAISAVSHSWKMPITWSVIPVTRPHADICVCQTCVNRKNLAQRVERIRIHDIVVAKCECGAAAIGYESTGTFHSRWCPLYRESK